MKPLTKPQIELLRTAPADWSKLWQDRRAVTALAARNLVEVEFKQLSAGKASTYRQFWRITDAGRGVLHVHG